MQLLMRLMTFVIVIVAGVGAAWFGRGIWDQWRLNDTTTQVQGIVTRSKAWSPYGRSSGRVDITFTYEYNGARYESERVFAADTRMWLRGPRYQEISATFPAGSSSPVWVRDDAPGKGFLIKEYRGEPYVFFLWAMTLLALSNATVLDRRQKAMRLVRGATPALWELRSAVSVDTRWRINVVTGGFLLMTVVIAGVHGMVTVQWDNMLWMFGLSAIVSMYVAGDLLVSGARQWYSRDAARMRVMVDRERAPRGEPLRVVVERQVRESHSVQSVDVTLMCTRGAGKKYVPIWSETSEVMDAEKIKQAQRDVLRAKATFLVPPHMPATGVDEQFGDVAWFVQVHTRAKGPDPNESWEIVVD